MYLFQINVADAGDVDAFEAVEVPETQEDTFEVSEVFPSNKQNPSLSVASEKSLHRFLFQEVNGRQKTSTPKKQVNDSTSGESATSGQIQGPTHGHNATSGKTATSGQTAASGQNATSGQAATSGQTAASGQNATSGQTAASGQNATSRQNATSGLNETPGQNATSGQTLPPGQIATSGQMATSRQSATSGQTAASGQNATSRQIQAPCHNATSGQIRAEQNAVLSNNTPPGNATGQDAAASDMLPALENLDGRHSTSTLNEKKIEYYNEKVQDFYWVGLESSKYEVFQIAAKRAFRKYLEVKEEESKAITEYFKTKRRRLGTEPVVANFEVPVQSLEQPAAGPSTSNVAPEVLEVVEVNGETYTKKTGDDGRIFLTKIVFC